MSFPGLRLRMKTHTIFLQYLQEVRRFSCSTAKAEPFDTLSTIRLLPQFVVHPIMEVKIFRLTYSEAVTSFIIKEAAKRPVIICQILALQFTAGPVFILKADVFCSHRIVLEKINFVLQI